MDGAIRVGLDGHRRYQSGLRLVDLYPEREDGLCRCGCGAALTARRRAWATDECSEVAVRRFRILKGDTREIRRALEDRDGGVCARCGGLYLPHQWEAHHIIPVEHGGGGCDLDGFATLCTPCHDAEHAP